MTDFWLWLIILSVIAIAQAWSKLAGLDQREAPPRPKPTRPARRPPRAPPVQTVPPPLTTTRQAAHQPMRKLLEQPGQHRPAKPPAARPAPTPPKPEPARPPSPPAAPAQPQPARASRARQWQEALRDRQNLRNVILASEIIGPPRGG
jgi:hypothetical protein